MAHVFLFDSSCPLDGMLANRALLVDAVAEGLGYQTDEEYLALTGILSRILKGQLSDTFWDVRPIGQLGLFAEVREDGTAYTYAELALDTEVVSGLPPAMLARFDQEVAETMDDL